MSADISIQSVGNTDPRVQIRSGPVYLVSLDQKKSPLFVAIKLDEMPNCIKVVGFYSDNSSNYLEAAKIMQAEHPEGIIEVMFPWRVVNSVQSLIYKHKGIK